MIVLKYTLNYNFSNSVTDNTKLLLEQINQILKDLYNNNDQYKSSKKNCYLHIKITSNPIKNNFITWYTNSIFICFNSIKYKKYINKKDILLIVNTINKKIIEYLDKDKYSYELSDLKNLVLEIHFKKD